MEATTSSAKSSSRTQTPRLPGRPTSGRVGEARRVEGPTTRATTLSCTPFTVLCSRFPKIPTARRSPCSQTPRQTYRGSHPTHQLVQDSDTLSQSHNRHTSLWKQRRASVQIHAGTAGNAQADEWAKWQHGTRRLGATALRVHQHVPGPPEARYHRAEVEARLSKHHAYRPRKTTRPAVATRFYQLRAGHALIGP